MANGSACGHGYMHARVIWSSGMSREETLEEFLMRDDSFFPAPDLHGRVALITGGCRGLEQFPFWFTALSCPSAFVGHPG